MKKFLLLIASLACVGAANAQSLSLAPAQMEQHAAYGLPATASETAIKWGYYFGDTFSGLGTQAAGTFGVAMKVPGTGVLNNAKVVSINLPVRYTAMSKVSVWGRKNINDTNNLFSQSIPAGSLRAGYNEIVLEAPYTIEGDFFVGYTFTVATAATDEAKFPMGIADGYNANGLWLSTGGVFENYSDQGFGVSALQLFLEDVNMVDYNAAFESISGAVTGASVVNTIKLTVTSEAKQEVQNIEYVATIGDKEETGTAEVYVPSGFGQSGIADIDFTAPAEIGNYNVEFTITKVNGEPNSNTSKVKILCENILRINPRKVLVEEFTGTGCGWCPRGWVAMEGLKETRSDICVPIAVHQYNTSDPMSIASTSYAALPVEGAPSSVIDRKVTVDPYYGVDGSKSYGIYDDIDARAGNSSIAVEVSGLYNADKTEVEAKADLEFLGDISTYRIEFVLTADSLAGTASSWKQQNYYYQYSPVQVSVTEEDDPELIKFCKGGVNGKSSVFLTFNDVAIASSYENRVNKAEALPTDYITGDKMTTTYTLKLPTKAALKNALKYDLIFVNALLFDDYGKCVNAARARVLTQEEAEGIEQIANDEVRNDGVMYNLSGQRVGENYRGIVVKNGKALLK